MRRCSPVYSFTPALLTHTALPGLPLKAPEARWGGAVATAWDPCRGRGGSFSTWLQLQDPDLLERERAWEPFLPGTISIQQKGKLMPSGTPGLSEARLVHCECRYLSIETKGEGRVMLRPSQCRAVLRAVLTLSCVRSPHQGNRGWGDRERGVASGIHFTLFFLSCGHQTLLLPDSQVR